GAPLAQYGRGRSADTPKSRASDHRRDSRTGIQQYVPTGTLVQDTGPGAVNGAGSDPTARRSHQTNQQSTVVAAQRRNHRQPEALRHSRMACHVALARRHRSVVPDIGAAMRNDACRYILVSDALGADQLATMENVLAPGAD